MYNFACCLHSVQYYYNVTLMSRGVSLQYRTDNNYCNTELVRADKRRGPRLFLTLVMDVGYGCAQLVLNSDFNKNVMWQTEARMNVAVGRVGSGSGCLRPTQTLTHGSESAKWLTPTHLVGSGSG